MTTSTRFWRIPRPSRCLDAIGYALANDAAMAEIPVDALKAAYVDPVTTPLFVQSPPTTELRDRMIEEFEMIKSGF